MFAFCGVRWTVETVLVSIEEEEEEKEDDDGDDDGCVFKGVEFADLLRAGGDVTGRLF